MFEKPEAEPAVQFTHAIEDRRGAKSVGGFRGEVSLDDALGEWQKKSQDLAA